MTSRRPARPARSPFGGPLLLYLQGAGLDGPATDAAGASNITNEEFSLFVQDQWQPRPNLTINYGLRWDAQLMPETVDPATTAYRRVPGRPGVPVRRHDPGPVDDVPAARRRRVGHQGQRQVGAARQRRHLFRAAEHAVAGRLGHDQRRAAADDLRQHGLLTAFGAPTPTWPGVLPVARVPPGEFPLFSGVRVFHRDYKNPRIYSYNVAYEQQLTDRPGPATSTSPGPKDAT